MPTTPRPTDPLPPAPDDEDPAWLDYRARFAELYDEQNYASAVQGGAMRAGHRLAEAAFGPEQRFDEVLEVGAGTGEHLPFVRHAFGRWTMTDADPRALAVAQRRLAATPGDRLVFAVADAARPPYPEASFDRVVATHVLEHLERPHEAIKAWCRLLRDGGVLTVLIPTDPGLAWRLGRHLGPRRHAQARGLAYDYVMAREHVNPCHNLLALLAHYLPHAERHWWPLRVPAIDLNLFVVVHGVVRRGDGG